MVDDPRWMPSEVIRSWRALRVDKLIYAALEATLLEHATGRAHATVPVIRMISATLDSLERRAQRIIHRLGNATPLCVTVQPGETAIGGGTAPGVTVPTRVLAVELEGCSPDDLEARLRRSSPPVIARIERDRVLVDLRTVQPEQDDALAVVLPKLSALDQSSE